MMQVFSALTALRPFPSFFHRKRVAPDGTPTIGVASSETSYPGCSANEDSPSQSEEPPGSRTGADSEPPSVLPETDNQQQLAASIIISKSAPPISQSPQSFKSRLLDAFLNFGLAPQILVYVAAALIFRSATMPITVSNLLGRALTWVQIKRNSQPYLVAINLLEPSAQDRTAIDLLTSAADSDKPTESLADVGLSDLVPVTDEIDLLPPNEQGIAGYSDQPTADLSMVDPETMAIGYCVEADKGSLPGAEVVEVAGVAADLCVESNLPAAELPGDAPNSPPLEANSPLAAEGALDPLLIVAAMIDQPSL